MLEYVKQLFLTQTKLAAQFEPVQTPQMREYQLQAEGQAAEESAEKMETPGRQMVTQARQEQEDGVHQSLEDRMREVSRQTMRMENLNLQKAARESQIQTRRLEQMMTALQKRQHVDILERTPDTADGGMTGSYRQKMEVAGIASSPSQRSMQEISRFFERDARRYG